MSRPTILDAAATAKLRSFSELLSPLVESAVVEKKVPSQRRILTSEEKLRLAMEEARKDGYDEGYAEGAKEGWREGAEIGRMDGKMKAYEEACQQYQTEIAGFVGELSLILGAIQEAIPIWYEQSEQAMTQVVMDAVKTLLATELQTSRGSALAIVQQALQEVTHARHARVRVNPIDSAILSQHRDELLAACGSLRGIDFVDDPNIRGGCVIETDGGIVDATVDTRLDLLEQTYDEAA